MLEYIECNKCGAKNTEDAKYCQECGSNLKINRTFKIENIIGSRKQFIQFILVIIFVVIFVYVFFYAINSQM